MSAVAQLTRILQAAGIPIDGVSEEQGGYRITYAASATPKQQATGESLKATFDPLVDAAAFEAAQVSSDVKHALDDDRLASAIVWTVLDTYTELRPATKAKYAIARQKVIDAYVSQPWK